MKNEIIYNYEPLWGEWKVEELLGKGSIGSVYKLSRDFFGEKQYSAVKVMSIPTEEQYNMYISSSGHSGDSKEFFEDLVKQIAKEINLLYQLKGHSNIITYEDHMIKNVGEKWHIFIRMECATCLSDYMANKTMETKEILQLGIDMCKALEFCHNRGIMHRDVKEENIFVSLNSKSFKLGDFSVSKETDSLSMAQTKVGTLNYMPPEIINGKTYNKNVDLYSLGLVLYKLLNKGRLPFLPNHPVKISINDIEQSYIKRLRGDVIPKPLGVNNEISNIILKACEYNPLKRYQNVEELKRELEKIFLNFSYLTDNTDKTSESIDETIGADLYNQNNLINQQNQNSYNNYLNNQQNQNSYNNNSNNQQNQNNFNNSLNSQQNQNSYNRNLNNQQNQNNFNNSLNSQQNQNSYNNNLNNQQNQNNFNNSSNSQQNQNSYNRNLNNQQNQNSYNNYNQQNQNNFNNMNNQNQFGNNIDLNKNNNLGSKAKKNNSTLKYVLIGCGIISFLVIVLIGIGILAIANSRTNKISATDALAYSDSKIVDKEYKTDVFKGMEFKYPKEANIDFLLPGDGDAVKLEGNEKISDYVKPDDDVYTIYISTDDDYECFTISTEISETLKEASEIYEDKNYEIKKYTDEKASVNGLDDLLLYYFEEDTRDRDDSYNSCEFKYYVKNDDSIFSIKTMYFVDTDESLKNLRLDYTRYAINSIKFVDY